MSEIGFGERDFAAVVGDFGRDLRRGRLWRSGWRLLAGGRRRRIKLSRLYDFRRRQRRRFNNSGRRNGNAGNWRGGSLKMAWAGGAAFFGSFFGDGQRQAVGLGGEAGGVFGLMLTRGGSVGVGQVCPDFALGDGFDFIEAFGFWAAFVVKRACPRLRLGQGF